MKHVLILFNVNLYTYIQHQDEIQSTIVQINIDLD